MCWRLGKCPKDVGMVIRKALWYGVVPCFGFFFGFPSLHVLSFKKMFFL